MFIHPGYQRLKAPWGKRTLIVALSLIALIAVVAFEMSSILTAQGAQGGRQTLNVMGDKDDLPNAPTTPTTCTRASNGNGTIQGKITDVHSGQPVVNAYVGVSPGLINSFGCYTYTNASGSFKIQHLPAGTYNLSASRWKVNGTDPLYRDSIVRQIPVGNSVATVNAALTPLQAPGYRVIGSGDAQNVILVDMDETYFNAWFTDKNSVADPKVTPNMHSIAKQGVNGIEDWTQYGYSPIDHYQLATGGFPAWRTPDEPAAYWTQPDPNLDVNLWYSGGPNTGEEFGQESIFDVAKSYGMNTAIIGGNDYPAGHITDANVDEINLVDPNPCKAPYSEIKTMESFINTNINNPNGFLLYAPLTQAEGFNTENTSPDAAQGTPDCSNANGWTYAKASVWDDQAFGSLLNYLNTTKQGSTTLMQNTTLIVTADEAENDLTNFDNFYPTQPGEPALGSTRHIPFVFEGPNIKSGVTYTKQLRIDDTSVNAMASLGLPAPADTRGDFVKDFFIKPPKEPLPPVPTEPIPSQGFVPLVENGVNGVTTVIQAQNEGLASASQVSLVVYDQSGKVIVKQPYTAPFPPNGDWVINVGSLKLPAGFVGTALLKSDQPLAIVSSATTKKGSVYEQSVEGYDAAEVGSKLYAPIMLNNANGVNSYLSITNLAPCGTCKTTVTISLYDQSGKLYASNSKGLAPHGELSVGISDFNLAKNTANFNAVITTSPAQPLGATVYATNASGRTFSYNAISAGDTSITSPLVYNAVNGQTTSLTVQNTTGTTANVTIAYRNASGKVKSTQTLTLAAHGSVSQSAASVGLAAGFTGSALITSDAKVAVVSLLSDTSGSESAFNVVRNLDYTLFTSAYEPQLYNAVSGVTSAVTVTNSGTTSTTAQIQYYTYNGNSIGSTPTATLAPGGSFTFNQGDASSGLPAGFVGAAYVSSSAAQQHLAVTVTFSGNSAVRSYEGSQAQTGQLVLTIGQMRQNYQQFTGEVVTVTNAIVTRNYGSNWYIQDNTGGIRVYVGGGVNEQIGDIQTVTGVLTDYSGDIEIDPAGASNVTKTGTGTVPTPVVVTTKQIAQLKYTDTIDGELVTIPVSTITTYNPPSLGLTDSSNVECTAYFDSYALLNINLSNFSKGEQVVTTGVLDIFGSSLGSGTGEINPLLTSDFVKH